MTDQQAPERIWIKPTEKEPRPAKEKHLAKWKRGEWKDHDGTAQGQIEYVRADLLEAAEKRIKELEGVIRAKDYDYNRAIDERDQALASVGAVIEKAVERVSLMIPLIEIDSTIDDRMHAAILEGVMNNLRSINPDATDALNEMLADAWDEGHTVGIVWPEKERNPYRKDRVNPHRKGQSDE